MTEFLKLKKSNCKNCYKCIRHCPVKSIRFSGNQAHIVGEECILCGQCFVVCPQNAKEIVDDTEKIRILIGEGKPVIASVAPSFTANYDGIGIKKLERVLQQLGFYAVEETAIGATMVKKEYEKILTQENRKVVISSCCPSVNLLIQKHFPSVLHCLAEVVSPMQAHCMDIKKRYPKAKTVFIGPCVSKKAEAAQCEDVVDGVMTFEELTKWMEQEGILLKNDLKELTISEENELDMPMGRARFFPTAGGILRTMVCDNQNYTYMSIDGVENCLTALEDIAKGNLTHCFIEMSACAGSCIGGPVMEKFHRSPIRDYQRVAAYAGTDDFQVDELSSNEIKKVYDYKVIDKKQPSMEEITRILHKMGKAKPEQELNCGSCGYNTCREKAIAVCLGKADFSMCLPFLKEKAESFSDHIIHNTPNAIVVLNEELEVQQINEAARKIMNIRSNSDVMGEPVIRILDAGVFIEVRDKQRNVHDRRTYLAEYNKYVEQTIIYDREFHILICIMRDVTEEEKEREKKEFIRKQTVVSADQVVDKQMRVVQEIASLLGETAAETKIVLTKLKESIFDE